MTKSQLQKIANDLGVELFIDLYAGWGSDAEAWTPPGKLFKATGGHLIVSHHVGRGNASALYQSLADDLKLGLVDCDDPDCEHCSGNEIE